MSDSANGAVLIAVPLWHRYPQSLASILALRNGGQPVHFLMLADDDPHDATTTMGAYANITRKYEMARAVCLAGDYAALLLVEDDMIVPPDALTRLLAADADVAYGLTCWRHGRPGWSPRITLDASGRVDNLSAYPDEARASWGKVIDVAGVGTFCTLVRRRVMERLAFRLSETLDVCCDWWLAVDCQREGFTQRADLGVVCGHIAPDPTPRVIWPDAREKRLWRVELLSPTSARGLTSPACLPAT